MMLWLLLLFSSFLCLLYFVGVGVCCRVVSSARGINQIKQLKSSEAQPFCCWCGCCCCCNYTDVVAGGSGEAGPLRGREDVAAQVPLQDEVRRLNPLLQPVVMSDHSRD